MRRYCPQFLSKTNRFQWDWMIWWVPLKSRLSVWLIRDWKLIEIHSHRFILYRSFSKLNSLCEMFCLLFWFTVPGQFIRWIVAMLYIQTILADVCVHFHCICADHVFASFSHLINNQLENKWENSNGTYQLCKLCHFIHET